jgi:hypothetical protein
LEEFDIYIQCFAGPRGALAESGLQRVFGLDQRRARELVQSLPRVVKRNVSGAHVAQYERVLQELGAQYELRRSAIRPQPIIAVVGRSAPGGAPDLQQHGSTLTLTLAPPAFAAPLPAVDASVQNVTGSQFARTFVDDRPPYGLRQEAMSEQSQRAPGEVDRFVLERAPAPVVRDEAAAPPSLGTWHDGTPLESAAAAPVPAFAPVQPLRSASPAPPTSGADAWASLEPRVTSARPLRPTSGAPESGASPSSWQAPGLELDGRPGWLVDARHMYRQEATPGGPPVSAPASSAAIPASPAASLQPPAAWRAPFAAATVAGAGQGSAHAADADEGGALSLDERAQPQPKAPRNQARAPRVGGAASVNAAPLGVTPHSVTAVGLHIGRELRAEDDEPPAMLRLLVRVGLGISLFVILTTVRQCSVVDSGIEDALAEWGVQPSEPLAPGVQRESAPAGGYGPPALQWMESELHQFSSGDKDRARSVARRYKKAGAVEVYVGSIMQSGPLHFAGELIVELPHDPGARSAVLAEHQRVLESSFGGFAPRASDPGGPVLRVTL